MDFSEDYADSILDPALTSQWLLQFPNLANNQIFAESLSVNFTKIPAKARHGGGSNTYFPDFNDIDAISVVFYENQNYETTKWINEWRRKVVKEDGTYGLPIEYKLDVLASFYPVDSETASLEVKFLQIWPTEQASIDYSNEDTSGRVKITVPFSVDSVKLISGDLNVIR
jgi:hypothetical protein